MLLNLHVFLLIVVLFWWIWILALRQLGHSVCGLDFLHHILYWWMYCVAFARHITACMHFSRKI